MVVVHTLHYNSMYLRYFIIFFVTSSHAKFHFDFGFLQIAKNPFQYLEENNYFYENHTIVTEDGYLLLLVRISSEKNITTVGSPVLFVHGIVSNFYDFLVAGPGIAVGFVTLEEGYDVFLLNTRGNRWSRKHKYLDPDLDAEKFWNFSWHEVGIYDITAAIDYIIKLTGYPKVSYVSHSQGSTSFLAMASTRPEYNKKIMVAILLAPVAYVGHAKFPVLTLFKNAVDFAQVLANKLNIYEIFPYNRLIAESLKRVCSPHSLLLPTCKKFYELAGPSIQINNSMISTYITNYPTGSSAMEALHFIQNAHSGEFKLYNYGKKANLAKYGQSKPPDYNLSKISSPVIIYYGSSDYFSAVSDVQRLLRSLPNVVKSILVSQTNHLDLLIGKRAKDLVTRPVLADLNHYNNL